MICSIDGKVYDNIIAGLTESFTVVEGKNSGTSLYRSRSIRDITGIKIGHIITFFRDDNTELFDSLCDYLFKTKRESVMLEVADGQSTIAYEAGYSAGSRKLITDTGDERIWDELTVTFFPMEAQIA